MKSGLQPYISVIIPTFNRLSLLRETVDSVRRQTFRDIEIIVVNDGSTDGTAEWLDTQTDLRHLDQANSGIATSRNNGAAIAEGDWFAFLDHDDLWAPDKLEIQTEFIRTNPDVGLVAARHVRLGRTPPRTRNRRWIKGDLLVKVFSESFIHTSSVIIRRDVFNAINGFPARYRFADEFDVWLKIAANYPIAYVDDTLVFIRFYESNTSHDRIGVRTDTYDILMKNYDPQRIPRQVFLRTLSDHDISFGRAHLRAENLPEALAWFARSVERTPWRLRSWRYYLKYRAIYALQKAQRYETAFHPDACRILNRDTEQVQALVQAALEEHHRTVFEKAAELRKNAPESAVSVVDLPGGLRLCVKEFRWRGWFHAFKGLGRPTQGLRTFRNGARLEAAGVGVALPISLIRQKFLGLARKEWVLMEVIAGALELDRYILSRADVPWTSQERRSLARSFGRFIGSMHGKGIFHADLKTCNILASGQRPQSGETDTRLPGAAVKFSLVDYDDVTLGKVVPERKRIKNLLQIFLSTPLAVGASDRLRFLTEYALHAGIDRKHRRKMARQILEAAKGRQILYVGFDGDIVEQWD